MNLVARVQDILLKPKATWPVIADEPGDIAGLYKQYLVYLVGVSVVAGFIGYSLVGVGMFGVSFRVPVLAGLANMVVGFVLTLVMVYVLALVANALAPTFGGQKDMGQAFKLVAYGSTAGLLGGVFNVLPMLSMLGLLAALYSMYLIYTGIPVLMKAPEDKALGYTVVLVLCGIVAGVVVGAVGALFTSGPNMGLGKATPSADVKISLPGTDITIDTAKLEAAGKKMEEASQRMEEAQARGDTEAAGKALGDLMGAMTGAQSAGQPIAPEVLQQHVPDRLNDLERTAIEARTDSAMGMSFSSVTAEYTRDNGRIEIRLQDIGAVPALSMAMGAWSQSTVNRETQDEVERVFKRDGTAYKESYRKDGSQAELTMLLPNSVLVELTGDNVDIDGVRAAAASMDLKALATVQRAK